MCLVPQKWGIRLWNSAQSCGSGGFAIATERRIKATIEATRRSGAAQGCGRAASVDIRENAGYWVQAKRALATKGVDTHFSFCIDSGYVVEHTIEACQRLR